MYDRRRTFATGCGQSTKAWGACFVSCGLLRDGPVKDALEDAKRSLPDVNGEQELTPSEIAAAEALAERHPCVRDHLNKKRPSQRRAGKQGPGALGRGARRDSVCE